MSAFGRIYRGDTDVDFPKLWKYFLTVSAVLVAISLGSLLTRGLRLSIDFRGGAVWEVPSKTMSTKDAVEVLTKYDKEGGAKVQTAVDADGRRIVRVQAEKSKNVKENEAIAQALAEKAGLKVEQVGTNSVGPSWGASITRDAAKALVVFLIVIALYISWQLEWRMAVSALAAVVHDVIVTVGVYSIFQFEVTPATVISFLTILGYSLYDTIVVYDRVQENTERYDRTGQYTYTAIMRRSLNQVLMRSLNTTLVALLPVISILLIGGVAFAQPVMKDFSLALFVGLLTGAYSSLAIASPLVVFLKEREPKYRRVRDRARDRGGAEAVAAADHIVVDHGVVVAPVYVPIGADATARQTATAVKASQYQRATPPRPRKQGKRR
jgi:preprotein translocase subunit SecF